MSESTSQELIERYEERQNDEMGVLHNRLVDIIDASKLSPPRVLLVLEMLKDAVMRISKQKYVGD